MRCLHRMPPRLLRVLALASVSLAGMTGCEMEADAPHEQAVEATATVHSGLAVTYFDFIGNAPGAGWHNNDGAVTWGTNTNKGACLQQGGVMENGTNYASLLYTHPKLVANGFMHAAFPVTIPAASYHPTFNATFGFKQGASGTSGVRFSLTTQINGSWVTLFSQNKSYTGALSTATVDLSAYAGQSLSLFLNVDAGANSDYDWAAWTDVTISADSGVPLPNSCTIGGVNYAEGAPNPSVSCQVCNPIESVISWSIRADSCQISGTCYNANVTDALGCKRCDPLTSQTAWTTKDSCDNLIVSATSTTGATTDGTHNGDWDSGSYPDNICASDAAANGLGTLPGSWKAIYSDPTIRNLKDTVKPEYQSMRVVNLQGQQLYSTWTSIFGGGTSQTWPSGVSMYRLDGVTTGSYIWTGSSTAGVWDTSGTTGGNCGGWKDAGPIYWHNTAKYANLGSRQLLNSGNLDCWNNTRFACVLVPPDPPITIQNYDGTAMGGIQGKAQGDAMAYLGIPYAAPPTGSLRLAPPAKVTAWSGVRLAFNQADGCPQPPLLPLGGMIGSEDCLYLNVWTPKNATPTSNLPVLVFHHGGAHIFGGTKSSDDWLATGFIDGDRFASAQNALVVTLQSRQGPLGFMADPALAVNSTSRTSTVGGGTSGNYGLLDVIQALKWIKRNISKFGGDPNKVSFSGESSGATVVCDLLASPLAKDPADSNKPYFSSVIMESGFCEQPSVSYRHTQAASQINLIGCGSAPDKVACLRSASLQSFVNTEGSVLGFFPDWLNLNLTPEFAWGLSFGPHIDGYVLPAQPRTMFAAGTHNKVPAIVGTNKDEGNFMMLFMVGGILTGDLPNRIVLLTCFDRDQKVATNFAWSGSSTLPNAITNTYPCSSFDGLSPTKTYSTGITHAQYECPARRTARALATGQTQPVRRYWFTHAGDNFGIFQNLLGLARDIGAAHSYELPYIFNSHDTMLGYWPSTREKNLTQAFQKYWRAFANSGATGDPNYTGGVNWTQYTIANDNTLALEVAGVNGGTKMVNGVDSAQCDFWDNNYTLDGWK